MPSRERKIFVDFFGILIELFLSNRPLFGVGMPTTRIDPEMRDREFVGRLTHRYYEIGSSSSPLRIGRFSLEFPRRVRMRTFVSRAVRSTDLNFSA